MPAAYRQQAYCISVRVSDDYWLRMSGQDVCIPAIVSNADMSAVISASVIAVTDEGHIPRPLSANVVRIAGMMIPVRGRAIRLVMRK